ncbi:MAG: hypothetical protein F6K11_34330 [Leptolyngbya sp. SIO3F4]|nr:hypothetical protein [Leptolyngbya sp. SIO3F4]
MKFLQFPIQLRFSRKICAAISVLTALVFGLCLPASARPSPVLWENSGWVTVGPRETVSLYSRCTNDRVVVSGGFHSQSASGNRGFKVIDSYAEDAWTWRLRLRNTNDSARQVKIQRICIKPSEF